MSEATIKSHAIAIENPMPTAAPRTAAITGFSRLTMALIIAWRVCIRARAATRLVFTMVVTSLPAQNARPAPLIITARTLSSV